MDSESSEYDESDYDSEEQQDKGEPSDARNTREARIASIMDVLQEIEEEDPTLMIEARERRSCEIERETCAFWEVFCSKETYRGGAHYSPTP